MPNLNTDSATVENIIRPSNCLKKVSVSDMAYQRAANLNLSGMTVTDGVIQDIVMNAAEVMKKITGNAKKITVSGQFTQDQGYYANSLSVDLSTLDDDSRNAILDSQNYCDHVFWLKLSNGYELILGLDERAGELIQVFDQVQDDHSYSLGGDSESTNIVTWKFENFAPYLPSAVGVANVPFG